MTVARGSLDLAMALRAIGAEPAPRPAVEALFFHRTLARWLGLPEGVVDGVAEPVEWDYGWWRADLTRHPEDDADGRMVFAAHLASASHSPEETVRWWVKKDARGRIIEADWLTAPPRLLDDEPPTDAGPLDDGALVRLFADDD
jgi:hypothetical protein